MLDLVRSYKLHTAHPLPRLPIVITPHTILIQLALPDLQAQKAPQVLKALLDPLVLQAIPETMEHQGTMEELVLKVQLVPQAPLAILELQVLQEIKALLVLQVLLVKLVNLVLLAK